MSDFTADLADSTSAMRGARVALRARVAAFGAGDLERERRGGWPVRRVLEHVVESEIAYARVIAHLRGAEAPAAPDAEQASSSPASAVAALDATRDMLLRALDGVREGEFYELRSLGHEQYSVLSVLQNVAAHDHEHLAQIERILAG